MMRFEEMPTREMVDWYEKRTARHISLVGKYCDLIMEEFPGTYVQLQHRKTIHDDSKYKDPERMPYIWISWQYHMKDLGKEFTVPQTMKDAMNVASKHHVTTNSHHPEYHDPNKNDEIINRENRDLPPKEMIDATAMPDIDIAEMVADWCAMSEEKGSNTPREWADRNVNVRWSFTNEQRELIYELIDKIW